MTLCQAGSNSGNIRYSYVTSSGALHVNDLSQATTVNDAFALADRDPNQRHPRDPSDACIGVCAHLPAISPLTKTLQREISALIIGSFLTADRSVRHDRALAARLHEAYSLALLVCAASVEAAWEAACGGDLENIIALDLEVAFDVPAVVWTEVLSLLFAACGGFSWKWIDVSNAFTDRNYR